MKRAILREFDDLGEKLSSLNGIFAYRLRNLCVKAEEMSLLPIEVLIEGEPQKLEQCTTIGKEDDYSFMIIPKYDEDMEALGHAITIAHPEFKQEIKSMKVDAVDQAGNSKDVDVRYILVTMPEVDNDRYDVLKDGVKVANEECKAQMEAANTKLKTGRDKLNEQWNGQREKIYNEKLQEIEDAHNKWLAEREEKEQKRQEDEASHGDTAAHSMKLDELAN